MSLTDDAVKVFKNTMLFVKHKPEGRDSLPLLIDPPELSVAAPMIDESLLAVARDSADIRREHDSILAKTSALLTLQDELHAAFDRAYQALGDLAEARSLLAKAERTAKFERDAREAVSERLASTTSDYHRTVAELERLRPDVRRLDAALAQANERVADLEGDQIALSARIEEARTDIERRRAEEAQLRREHDAVHVELAAANAYIGQKIAEIAQLHERCEIAEQASRASARALDEARSEAGTALARLDEERVALASAESRVVALEAQLRGLTDKFSSASAGWTQDAERAHETVSRLKDELAQAMGRDEALQRLLSGAQSEAGQLRRQHADQESQISELRLKLTQALARAENAETARDQRRGDLATSRNLHQSLLRRVKPLIASLRDKSAESGKLSATLADFEKRFATYQAESGATIRHLQDKETQLVADLEAERARRVVAEGSLAIDRSFRPSEAHRGRPEAGA
jgi:chromosome segregation ATPase